MAKNIGRGLLGMTSRVGHRGCVPLVSDVRHGVRNSAAWSSVGNRHRHRTVQRIVGRRRDIVQPVVRPVRNINLSRIGRAGPASETVIAIGNINKIVRIQHQPVLQKPAKIIVNDLRLNRIIAGGNLILKGDGPGWRDVGDIGLRSIRPRDARNPIKRVRVGVSSLEAPGVGHRTHLPRAVIVAEASGLIQTIRHFCGKGIAAASVVVVAHGQRVLVGIGGGDYVAGVVVAVAGREKATRANPLKARRHVPAHGVAVAVIVTNNAGRRLQRGVLVIAPDAFRNLVAAAILQGGVGRQPNQIHVGSRISPVRLVLIDGR